MVLDPLSSQGNLRAMMMGIAAGHLAHQVLHQGKDPHRVAAHYQRWVLGMFRTECSELIKLYGALSPALPWLTTARRAMNALDELTGSNSAG